MKQFLKFCKHGYEYQLLFDTPELDLPELMTNREALERYCGFNLPKEQITPLAPLEISIFMIFDKRAMNTILMNSFSMSAGHEEIVIMLEFIIFCMT